MNLKEKLTGKLSIRTQKQKLHTVQLVFTCSKLTIEAPEQGVKYVQSKQ